MKQVKEATQPEKHFYINFKSKYGFETVDETDNRKDAKYLVGEYNLAFGGGCYISQRPTKGY